MGRWSGSPFYNGTIQPHPTDMNLLISHMGEDAWPPCEHLGTTTNTDG
jgi:hypothetical protein